LLEIKNGNLEYDEILLVADHLISSIENSYLTSKLIEKPNQVKIENILIEMRKILYQ
jgi:hypothetical protein